MSLMITPRAYTIGIVFRPSDWMGGTYYVLNLVTALGYLEPEQQPEVIVFTDSRKNFEFISTQSGYSKLRFQKIPDHISYHFFERIINKIYRTITGKNLIRKYYKGQPDILYPYSYHPYFENVKKAVYWVADLQDKVYPDFFSQAECEARDKHYKKLAGSGGQIVFSSQAAANDFKRFYPNATARPYVLHFAAVNRFGQALSKEQLCRKYQIPENYFYSPNQFWKHKNHIVVIDALAHLKKKGIYVNVIFSGNENDPRHPGYVTSLKEKVKELGLQNQVFFLGFIDREDVFALMKNARAVIQPSLFEGWSTVVEDAMSVNAPLILSDLEVNREQAQTIATYFDPGNALDLAQCLEKCITTQPLKYGVDYVLRIRSFAKAFVNLVTLVKDETK